MEEVNAMSEPETLQAADEEKLKTLLKKDEKAGRKVTGFWYLLASGMGVFMVLFYMWCAATPVDTQYFLGFYVLLTYVLVFIYYGGTGKSTTEPGFYIDSCISFVALFLSCYFALHFLIGAKGAEEPFAGFNIFYGIVALVVSISFFLPIRYWGKAGPNTPIAMDVALALVAAIAIGYFIIEYENINYRMGSETPLDTAVSVVGIVISLEVARRVLGWSMTIVGLAFLSYAFWGDLLHHVPILDAFAHTGFKIDRALNHIYMKQEGVFGIMATVLVTYVILFIFFGAFLKSSGASRFFLDLPMALAGRTIGGPAKVAVMASGFFGSVSGSAIANTVSTGAFTIPLMKRAGFRPHVAGAIEPSASIGGMFMPPIMGAGGFIMAEMTEIPYVDIMVMAVFPAVIYFLSVFVMIHYEAKRYGLVGIVDEKAPTALQILKKEWFMSAPLLVIVILMLLAYSPGMAAYWAIMTCLVVAWMDADFLKGIKEGLRFIIPVLLVGLLGAFFPISPLVLAIIGLAALIVIGALTKGANVTDGKFDAKDFCITFIPGFFFVVCAIDYNPEFLDVSPVVGFLQSLTGTPAVGAFMAFVSYTLVGWIIRGTKLRYKEIMDPLLDGARNTLIIGATVGVIGIIVGTIQLTGIGLKFSQIIIDLSFGYLPLAIILIGLASLVLGMGVPVTAAYLITAVLAVGAVSNMVSQSLWGMSFAELQMPLENLMPDQPEYAVTTAKVSWALLASHMLVYWFSQDSNITPPVCVAAYAGAAIAGSDPWKTGWTSFKFAKMLYIGPFLFAFTPGFLLGGPGHFVPWWEVCLDWFTIILGTFAFGSLTMGYFLCGTTIIEWVIFALATLLLFFPKIVPWIIGIPVPILIVDMVGIGLWAVVYFSQKIRIRKDPTLALPIDQRRKLAAQAA
jgi:TRAP-type uncharacterized transport system fused permease subunit